MTRITVWIDWISTLCAKMGKVIVLVGGTGILLSMAIGVFPGRCCRRLLCGRRR